MRNEILTVILFLLVPWELNRTTVIQFPEVHMDQEGGVVVAQQPAEGPLIFRILYPWAVPREVIRGGPQTRIEEENMKRTEQPV